MPSYSERSKKRLATCHKDLQFVFNEVIKHIDCVILEGHRNKEAQDAAVADGKSQTKWPTSKHNSTPSNAVDAAPYPINWNDTNSFIYFAGFVKGVAASHGIRLRWGGDWDNDNDQNDQKFFDRVHFEIQS